MALRLFVFIDKFEVKHLSTEMCCFSKCVGELAPLVTLIGESLELMDSFCHFGLITNTLHSKVSECTIFT